jgi:hypothetical protein
LELSSKLLAQRAADPQVGNTDLAIPRVITTRTGALVARGRFFYVLPGAFLIRCVAGPSAAGVVWFEQWFSLRSRHEKRTAFPVSMLSLRLLFFKRRVLISAGVWGVAARDVPLGLWVKSGNLGTTWS